MTTGMIYTAGYAGLKPEQVGAWAEQHGAVIVDVRFKPFSRDAEWRKPALIKLFGSWYRHVEEWGNENYRSDAEIKLKDFRGGLEKVRPILTENKPIILLCACWSYLLCHRKVVADRLYAELGMEITHLSKKDFPSLESLHKEQEELF